MTWQSSCGTFLPMRCGLAIVLSFAATSKALLLSRHVPLGRARCGAAAMDASMLHEPAYREENYKGNLAKYLVDLHDSQSTFDFCGGMMFQLVLSDALRGQLASVAEGDSSQPVVYDKQTMRMFGIPDYNKDAEADNIRLFHGREVRKVPNAAGGMNFVLHLSLANGDDPEGRLTNEPAHS